MRTHDSLSSPERVPAPSVLEKKNFCHLFMNLTYTPPIFSQTTERIWKKSRPLESISDTIFTDTWFAYQDLVENVKLDYLGQTGLWHFSKKCRTSSQSTRITTNGEKYWISHSITQNGLREEDLYAIGGLDIVTEKRIKKARVFSYILITTAPITTMLTASNRKNRVFLGYF